MNRKTREILDKILGGMLILGSITLAIFITFMCAKLKLQVLGVDNPTLKQILAYLYL